tara:strand:- start:2418 stop:2585 length:168 start_codon:yes stop_codon:yes gene_type:complete
MPAVSKAQQRFFGLVKSMQKGDTPKEGEAGKVAKTMIKMMLMILLQRNTKGNLKK